MASSALAFRSAKDLPEKMPPDMKPTEAWDTIVSLFRKVESNRRQADQLASQTERVADSATTIVLSLGAGFLTPIFFEAVPKIKRIGAKGVYVDTQAILGGAQIVAALAMAWFGQPAHRVVLGIGLGTSASWAGIKGQELGRKWFAKKAA